jgi:glycolate oxidase FAD binding subunit
MSASGFESIVGAAHVEAVEAASLDAVPVQALVRPADAEQLAACLAHAREQGLAVVPTGGGSKLDGANPLDAERCVRLDLRRLDRLDLDPDEGIASVGAGACLADLQAAARERGKRVLFPGARPGATLGGTFSSDEIDPDASPDRHAAYEVLGATAALADGTLARAGGSVVKNVTGFDLVRLYAGAFGRGDRGRARAAAPGSRPRGARDPPRRRGRGCRAAHKARGCGRRRRAPCGGRRQRDRAGGGLGGPATRGRRAG